MEIHLGHNGQPCLNRLVSPNGPSILNLSPELNHNVGEGPLANHKGHKDDVDVDENMWEDDDEDTMDDLDG